MKEDTLPRWLNKEFFFLLFFFNSSVKCKCEENHPQQDGLRNICQ